ncbi:unnamed protein product [Sphagnum compactum]
MEMAAAAMATRSVAVSTGVSGEGCRRSTLGGGAAATVLLGMKNSRLSGVKLASTTGGAVIAGGVSRVQCRAAAVATPRVKDNLLAEAEQRWERALETPLEGVQFTYEEFADALSKYDFSFEIGDTVKGIVFKTDYNGALIDIGAKAPAYLPLSEACIFKLKSVEEMGLVAGVEEEFSIIRDDDDNGRMILSLKKLQNDFSWERCRQLQMDDVVIRGKALSANRGGVVVEVEGLRGFVPFSQISARQNPEEVVDKELPLKFLEVDEERTRLVLSNRKAIAENHVAFGIGSVVVGTVQTVKPYGAFIDIGGVSGLLHISQISHDRLTTVETVLSPGDKLKVMILSQDKERGRISLSTKKLEPTPGDMLRNPALVYEKADEMAKTFRQRVAQAEAAARAEELRLQQEGGLGLRGNFGSTANALGLNELDLADIPPAVQV